MLTPKRGTVSPARPIRVLIVDDSALVRQTMAELIASEPGLAVMATAPDPFVAARRISEECPDVITLDVEMPRMDGVTFLRRIMAQRPIPVLMCSSRVGSDSEILAKVMAAGAVDVICKPDVGVKEFLEESRITLCDAIRAAARARLSCLRQPQVEAKLTADAVLPPPRHLPPASRAHGTLIAVGASTGGTEALRVFLEQMPPGCPPIVIVQHMPEAFTTAFAQRLDSLCRIAVREARSGTRAERGSALIAPGGHHMVVRRQGAGYAVDVRDGPLVSRHRPSVDVLFRSVAQAAGPEAIGVIMTGMGDDGARGLREMRDAGASTLGQDEASSVVYGMANEAAKAGAVQEELPLDRLAARVLAFAAAQRA